jgi:hypothetical protein
LHVQGDVAALTAGGFGGNYTAIAQFHPPRIHGNVAANAAALAIHKDSGPILTHRITPFGITLN